MNPLHDAAQTYAARGWPVLPLHTITHGHCSCGRSECSSPGKHPRTKNGLKNASVDQDQIADWWDQWPAANIGLLTGVAFDVLDIDGAEGIANFKSLVDQNEPLPPGPRSYTGGGGRHILFAPTGIGNRAGIIPKVDWRGTNGYIVAAPSLHASGNTYEWHNATLDPPDTPGWLRLLLDPPKPARDNTPPRVLPTNAGDGTPYGLQALDGEIRELGRATQGVTLIGLDEGAKLSGLQRIVENDANGTTDGDDSSNPSTENTQ